MKKVIPRIIVAIAIILGIVAGYKLTALLYPKNLNRYPFFLILILMDLYLCFKYIALSDAKKRSKQLLVGFLSFLPSIAITLAMVVGYFLPPLQWKETFRIYLFGSIFSLFTAQFFSVLILLISDAIRWLRRKNKKTESPSSKAIKIWIVSLNVLVIFVMVFGMVINAHRFKVHEVELNRADLPHSFDGFKVVQLSDIHTGSWSDLKSFEKAIKIVQSLNPDMIVFTGDIVNATTDEAYRFEKLMSSFSAPYGKYAILGNHDYGEYASWNSKEAKIQNLADLESFYERTGWHLLKNQFECISKNGDTIGLVGVENWGDNLRFPQYGDLDLAMKEMPELPFVMLLSHDPSHWTKVVTRRYPQIDLTLSGHTHGFQFGMTIGDFEWSPVKFIYPTWAGLYEDNDQLLYVNRGLGCLSYPGRIGILPEITLFTLHTTN